MPPTYTERSTLGHARLLSHNLEGSRAWPTVPEYTALGICLRQRSNTAREAGIGGKVQTQCGKQVSAYIAHPQFCPDFKGKKVRVYADKYGGCVCVYIHTHTHTHTHTRILLLIFIFNPLVLKLGRNKPSSSYHTSFSPRFSTSELVNLEGRYFR